MNGKNRNEKISYLGKELKSLKTQAGVDAWAEGNLSGINEDKHAKATSLDKVTKKENVGNTGLLSTDQIFLMLNGEYDEAANNFLENNDKNRADYSKTNPTLAVFNEIDSFYNTEMSNVVSSAQTSATMFGCVAGPAIFILISTVFLVLKIIFGESTSSSSEKNGALSAGVTGVISVFLIYGLYGLYSYRKKALFNKSRALIRRELELAGLIDEE